MTKMASKDKTAGLTKVIEKYGDLPLKETGAKNLEEDIAEQIFYSLRPDDTGDKETGDLKVSEVWALAYHIKQKLSRGYLIISKDYKEGGT